MDKAVHCDARSMVCAWYILDIAIEANECPAFLFVSRRDD
jgi:hypothetical protein